MNNSALGWTTIEQTKQLIGAGIDPDTADMCYINEVSEGRGCVTYSYKWTKYPVVVESKEEGNGFPEPITLPCWSLGRLFSLIPGDIGDEWLYLGKFNESYWLQYEDENGKVYGERQGGKDLVEILCRTICWLLRKGRITPAKEKNKGYGIDVVPIEDTKGKE